MTQDPCSPRRRSSRPRPLEIDRRTALALATGGSAALALSGVASAAPTGPLDRNAPTATTRSPEQIDADWRGAAAKFDAPRKSWGKFVSAGAHKGPFRPDWTSLKGYAVPSWYQDAKFGIFVHWGPYSVPAFAEWYARLMYQKDSAEYKHHVATYGPPDKFGYKDFIPLFKGAAFDPAAWAKLFRDAGARYVVPVAEHHDGFSMYKTRLSEWSSVTMGPKRDVIGELSAAIRAQGLRFGVSSHRAENDWFFDEGRKIASDVNDPRYRSLYGPAQVRVLGNGDADLFGDFTPVSQAWLDDWTARTAELIESYQPDLIYFDWWIGKPEFREALPNFLAYYYNREPGAGVVNYKLGGFSPGTGVMDIERGQAEGIQPMTWQTCTSISDKAWAYVENDTYKSADSLVHLLIDVVSKNGNLLLNIGPRPDGSIHKAAEETLLAIGGWLRVNGEAIYDTRPWRVFGEGPTEVASGSFQDTKSKPYTAQDFRFTTKAGKLYALALGWPDDGAALITAVKPSDRVQRVTLLGNETAVPHQQTPEGLRLTLPKTAPGVFAYAFRIELA